MDQLRVGVVGVGLIGALHARVYAELPNATLIGVADPDEEAASLTASRLQCDHSSDVEAFLKRDDIDAVSICVPDSLHVEPGVLAAENGKHVLMEKPIARTVADARKIVSACQVNHVGLMVAHLLRFDPRYVRLAEDIRNGDLGEVLHMYAKRQNPKGIAERLKGRTSMLFYVGIHDIDLLNWYMGQRATEVYAQKVQKENAKHDTQDCIFLSVRYEGGALASLHFSWALPQTFPAGILSGVEVVGTQGAGYVSVLDQGVSLYTSDGAFFPDTLHWPETNGRISGDLRDELQHFVQATLDGTPYLVPTAAAIHAVEIIEAAFRSIETNGPVTISG